MKPTLFSILLVGLLLGTDCSRTRLGTVEFVRPENNGFVNIVPCTLVLSDHRTLTLVGGESATVSLPPESFSVRVFSIDPYTPDFDIGAWSSSLEKFHISGGEQIRLFVEPCSSGSTYSGGWGIYRTASDL